MNCSTPIDLGLLSTSYGPQEDAPALSIPRPLPLSPPTSPKRNRKLTAITLLPAEKRFGSPLKRKREEDNPEKEESCSIRKRLFFEINEVEQAHTVSSTNLEEQKKLINEFINEHLPDQVEEINKYVNFIENSSLSLEQKLAELGVLCFYLVRDNKLPQLVEKSSFIQLRYEEIYRRIIKCETIHSSNCPRAISALLPSGKVIELMRACARLIFTPNGSYNPGGCEAVKLLLNSELSFAVTQEIRAQMLTIIDKLLEAPEFYKLFLTEHASIHADAAEFIRIDLFLQPGEEVGSLHACWAKLVSLFSVISQINEGNCFAISLVFNFFRQQPEIILELFNQMIEKGTLCFFGEEVPLCLLIEGRKSYEKDFEQTLKVASAVNLTGISVVRTLFGKEEVLITKEEDTLQGIFAEQFQASQDKAKHQYLALKRNLFQQGILGFFQFVAMNTPLRTKNDISFKELFFLRIEEIISAHFDTVLFRKKLAGNFVNEFLTYLKHFFCFIDYRNGECRDRVEGDRIFFLHHSKGLLLGADDLSAFRKFSVIRRLFYVKEGIFQPIDSISSLANCFSEVLISFLAVSGKKKWGNVSVPFEQYINDKQFKIDIAKVNAALNQLEEVLFDAKKYYESDAIIFVPDGGDSGLLLSSITQNRLYKEIPITAKDINSLFVKLCNSLRTYIEKKPLFLKQHNPTFPIASASHDFVLYPLLFSKLILGNSQNLLKQFVFDRAKKIRCQKPTTKVREAILYDAFEKNTADEILQQIPQEISSVIRFALAVDNWLKANNKTSELRKFKNSFEKTLTHITFVDFEYQLPNFLNLCGFNSDIESVEKIKNLLKSALPVQACYSLAELSRSLHYALVSIDFGYISTEAIEDCLADIFELPYVIKLGNLNWVPQLDEAPKHDMLVIKVNLLSKKLVLCYRRNGVEIPLKDDFSAGIIKDCVLSLPA